MSDPLLRLVRGDPTAAELAALLAVLAVLSAGRPEPTPGVPSGWSARRAGLRWPVQPGPGAWAASGRAPGVRTRSGW